jgi:LPS-assembly lipoprotein
MWWCDNRKRISVAARLATVLTAASLLAGCFEPLYGRNPSLGDESVRDKLAEVLIAPIPMRQGTPQARIAVAMRNALQFDFNGAAGATSPTHRLDVTVTPTDISVSIDPVTGRPTEEIGGLNATYQMVEIATGKIVLKDSTFAHVGYDIPGLRQAARLARCGGPRREGGRRGDPQPARVLFRRRHLSMTRANGRAVWQNPRREPR